MDINRILQRAFDLTLSYKSLWLFGFIVALTSMRGGGNGGGGSGGGGGGSSSLTVPTAFSSKLTNLLDNTISGQETLILIALGILVLLVVVLFAIGRVVSVTALIRMVNEVEQSGRRPGVREGFRLGWSRPAFRIFLIDLFISLAAVLVIILLLGVALAPMLLWLANNEALSILGTLVSIAFLMPVFPIIIVLVISLAILQEFFHRAAAIENKGVFASIRHGWEVARQRLWPVFLLALILFVIGLGAAFLLIPLVLLLVVVGVVIGTIPGLATGLIASLFAGGDVPWIAGLVIGMPAFLTVVILPLAFINGLFEVFSSNAWTLAYRDMIGIQPVQTEPAQ